MELIEKKYKKLKNISKKRGLAFGCEDLVSDSLHAQTR